MPNFSFRERESPPGRQFRPKEDRHDLLAGRSSSSMNNSGPQIRVPHLTESLVRMNIQR